MKNDTICAISTPLGISGIGIIRLSGPETYRIIEEIFVPKKKRKKVSEWKTHTVHYGYIMDGEKIVDEVLVTIMRAPKSYTREDMAEIGCHGGLIALKEVLNLCIKKGARLANPGEFTLRAFLNGRIDLTQAESVLEIVNSQTEKSLEISLRKLKGEFSEKINKIREEIFDLLTNIEAKIDFPEEEDVSSYSIDIKRRVEKIKEEVERIIEKAGKGKILYEGVKASIVGRANVGKSSILNRLLKEERAIVTEIPGTTRDILQEVINIKGIPVKIIDTAGIRKPKSKIEKMGVEKAIEWMEKSEMNLLVLDGSQRLKKDDEILLEKIKEKAYLIIINKIDLPLKLKVDYLKRNFPEERIVFVSAKTGEGIDKLEDAIYRLICEGYGKIESSEFYINVREEELLKKIRDNLKNITENFDNLSIEVTAEFLKESLKNIDFITGRNFSQEILNNIFSKFCIGK